MSEQKTSLLEVIGGGIVAIFIIVAMVRGCTSDMDSSSTSSKPVMSQEQRQKLMKLTNDFVLEGQRVGLIKKVDKQCDSQGCIYTFWVNENIYNQYGYEDKQGAKRLFMEYGKLRGEGGIARGYYSGKYL